MREAEYNSIIPALESSPGRGDGEFCFDNSLAGKYKSKSQKARIMTEAWIEQHAFCPLCGKGSLNRYPANRPVADFFCPSCHEEFELKSKRQTRVRQKRILAGAYRSMVERVSSRSNPNLLLMMHDGAHVSSLCFIPKHFFTLACIEPRKPLGPGAKRAGWQGCQILLDMIPDMGKIVLIRDSKWVDAKLLARQLRQCEQMCAQNMTQRGWLMDVARCLEALPSDSFDLKDVYKFESTLQMLHPNNCNIRPKIRQQLQLLRDRGIIEFTSQGKYCKISA